MRSVIAITVHYSRVSVFVKEGTRFSVAQLNPHQPAQPFLELILIQAARHRGRRVAQHAPSPLVLIVSRDLHGVFVWGGENDKQLRNDASEKM